MDIEWKALEENGALSAKDTQDRILFLDVRPASQSEIVTLTGVKDNVCCPLSQFRLYLQECENCLHTATDVNSCLMASELARLVKDKEKLYIYCRMGNASRAALSKLTALQRTIADSNHGEFLQKLEPFNVVGGLTKLKELSSEWGDRLEALS